MRGNDAVIAHLNSALASELGAICQYILHSEMCHNWGYHKLGAYIKKQAIDEMKHAESLVERILFLEGQPNLAVVPPIRLGMNVQAQLDNDLAAELEAVRAYNEAAAACVAAGDNGSRELFEKLVKDEEQHADFLESQISIVKDVGMANFLAQQMDGEAG